MSADLRSDDRDRDTAPEDEGRSDDRRPRRRRSRCPFCGSWERPEAKRVVSQGGWVTFFIILFLCPLFCWIGLLFREDAPVCWDCGKRLDR